MLELLLPSKRSRKRTIRSLGSSLNLEDYLALYASDFVGAWKRIHQIQIQGNHFYDFGEDSRQVEAIITYSLKIFRPWERYTKKVVFSVGSEEDWLSKKYQITHFNQS